MKRGSPARGASPVRRKNRLPLSRLRLDGALRSKSQNRHKQRHPCQRTEVSAILKTEYISDHPEYEQDNKYYYLCDPVGFALGSQKFRDQDQLCDSHQHEKRCQEKHHSVAVKRSPKFTFCKVKTHPCHSAARAFETRDIMKGTRNRQQLGGS